MVKNIMRELDENLEDLLSSIKQESQGIITENELFDLCQVIICFQEENKRIVNKYIK